MTEAAVEIATEFEGLKVPHSPFLGPKLAKMIGRGNYERPERKLAHKLTRDDDRIVELGTGIGFVGGFTALHRPKAQLRSFEANPRLIPHARNLYDINGMADRATVENRLVVANPDRPESMSFHLHGSFLGSSVFLRGMKDPTIVEVPTLAWDTLRDEFQPNVVIMDIEGAELDFMIHADLTGVRAVIVELHPKIFGQEGLTACLEAMQSKGFQRAHHRIHVWSFVREGVEFPR